MVLVLSGIEEETGSRVPRLNAVVHGWDWDVPKVFTVCGISFTKADKTEGSAPRSGAYHKLRHALID